MCRGAAAPPAVEAFGVLLASAATVDSLEQRVARVAVARSLYSCASGFPELGLEAFDTEGMVALFPAAADFERLEL